MGGERWPWKERMTGGAIVPALPSDKSFLAFLRQKDYEV